MSAAPHESDDTHVDVSANANETDAEGDALAPVREHRPAVEEIGRRDDRLGAAARILLTLADGGRPSAVALDAAGFGTAGDSF